ncbi:hypothetical protein GCK32_016341 [Trichostrongylus colubriformis]|uniref:K Homology domain-containing protein n=1 Tax=Trichostrongylus colubriformis TaxID=6319 RepID=A0AAN8FZC6_TRICO
MARHSVAGVEIAKEVEEDRRILEPIDIPAIKRKKANDIDNITVRLLLSPEDVGALLGSQGERVKTIKREQKCFVKVNEEICAGSSDRLCIVKGDVPNVVCGVGELIKTIAEHRSGESANSVLLDVLRRRNGDWPYGKNHAAGILKAKRTSNGSELEIPLKYIGAVMGRRGHVVRDIETYSLCKVQVFKEAADGRGIIRITGPEENVDIAKSMVERVVNEDYIYNLPSLHPSSSQ